MAQVDPLVSLMKVEKVPDSTYDMVGGLDQQIREIKEVRAASGRDMTRRSMPGRACSCSLPSALYSRLQPSVAWHTS